MPPNKKKQRLAGMPKITIDEDALLDLLNEQKSDNTRTTKKTYHKPIKVTLRPKEHYFEPDYRTESKRKLDEEKAQKAYELHQKEKEDEKREEGLNQLLAMTVPSTYVNAVTGLEPDAARDLTIDLGFGTLTGLFKNGVKTLAKLASKSTAKQTLSLPAKRPILNLPEPKQTLSLPEPKYFSVPEASYTGRIPIRTIDYKLIRRSTDAENLIKEILQDPNNYTFAEINDAILYRNSNNIDGVLPIELESSGKTLKVPYRQSQTLADPEELNKLNQIFNRYGYHFSDEQYAKYGVKPPENPQDVIPIGTSQETAHQMVLDLAKQHRTWTRGVYHPKYDKTGNAKQNLKNLKQQASELYGVPAEQVSDENILDVATTTTALEDTGHGRQNYNDAARWFGINPEEYDAIYMSNRDQTLRNYSTASGKIGQQSFVRMPIYDDDSWSLTKLWEQNEYPIIDGGTGDLSRWRTHELPALLQKNLTEQLILEKYSIRKQPKTFQYFLDTKPTNFIKKDLNEQQVEYLVGDYERAQKNADKYNITIPYPQLYIGDDGAPVLYGYQAYRKFLDRIFASSYLERKLKNLKIPSMGRVENLLGTGYITEKTAQRAAYQSNAGYIPKLKKDKTVARIPISKNKIKEPIYDDNGELLGTIDTADPNLNIPFPWTTPLSEDALNTIYKGLYKNDVDLYYKDFRLRKKKDAFIRRKQLEEMQKLYDKDLADNPYGSVDEAYEKAGVSPNYDKRGPHGEMVFTTEGIHNPGVTNDPNTHAVLILPRNTKGVDIVKKVNKGRGYGRNHSGDRIKGTSRNLGAVGAGITLTPKKKDKK